MKSIKFAFLMLCILDQSLVLSNVIHYHYYENTKTGMEKNISNNHKDSITHKVRLRLYQKEDFLCHEG